MIKAAETHEAGDDKTLLLFSRFIAKTMGLHFKPERLGELRQKCRPLCREFGHDNLEACLLWLMSEPLSRKSLEILARTLTIGETYFLRDPASFSVLEKELLPGLIASRRGKEKRLRIWSAGCSSGEEPYSIAILLSRLIPDLESWDVTLLGTDINPAALEKAARGVYSQWSFRDAPPWLLDYFERHRGAMEISPKIRKMVKFAHLNLAEEVFPSPASGTTEMDVIFCRNVMLYFGPELIAQVIDRFHAALATGGWLFVSPTEIDHRYFERFRCHRYPGALVFSKDDGAAEPGPAASHLLPHKRHSRPHGHHGNGAKRLTAEEGPHPFPVTAAPLPVPVTAAPPAVPVCAPAVEAVRPSEVAQMAAEAASLEERARQLADRGEFEEAKRYCEAAIEKERLRAESHYLLALILSEQGELEAAEATFKRALYIDHDFVLAYFALGNLCRQSGRRKEAQRHFTTALKLLERRDPEETVADTDGMTAGGLAEMIRRQKEMADGR